MNDNMPRMIVAAPESQNGASGFWEEYSHGAEVEDDEVVYSRVQAPSTTVEEVRTYTWNGSTHEISAPDLSDFEVAGRVRMLMRDQLNHEHVCTMARDRIMCLTAEAAALRNEKEGIWQAAKDQAAHDDAAIEKLLGLLREGADLLSVEADALKAGISVRGKMRPGTEDTHTVEAIEEIEGWIGKVASVDRSRGRSDAAPEAGAPVGFHVEVTDAGRYRVVSPDDVGVHVVADDPVAAVHLATKQLADLRAARAEGSGEHLGRSPAGKKFLEAWDGVEYRRLAALEPVEGYERGVRDAAGICERWHRKALERANATEDGADAIEHMDHAATSSAAGSLRREILALLDDALSPAMDVREAAQIILNAPKPGRAMDAVCAHLDANPDAPTHQLADGAIAAFLYALAKEDT